MKGQIGLTATIITAVGMVVASVFTSWATSSNRVATVEKNVSIVEERENNHFLQVQDSLKRIETKLDNLSDKSANAR